MVDVDKSGNVSDKSGNVSDKFAKLSDKSPNLSDNPKNTPSVRGRITHKLFNWLFPINFCFWIAR